MQKKTARYGIQMPDGVVVFSVIHPCFHSAAIQRFSETNEDEAGRHVIRNGIKVSQYLSSFVRKSEGIIGQPEPQFYFHRPMNMLFQACFKTGFIMTGMEEPGFPAPDKQKSGIASQGRVYDFKNQKRDR
jgi:hypothetical protein